jgi:hypothetical protein
MGKYLDMVRVPLHSYELNERNEEREVLPTSLHSTEYELNERNEESQKVEGLNSFNSFLSYQSDDKTEADLARLEAVVNSDKYEGANFVLVRHYLERYRRGDAQALDPLLVYLEKPEVQAILWQVN